MKFRCLPNSIEGEKRCQQCADRNLECKPIIPPKSTRFGVSPKHARVDLIMSDPEDAPRNKDDSSCVVVSNNVGAGAAGLGLDLNKTSK